MTITTNTFKSVVADNGYKLTLWREGDDILNFSSFSRGAFPLAYDTTQINEITVEEAERLEALKEAAEEESIQE